MQAGNLTKMATSSESVETGSAETMSPRSIIVPHRTFTDLNRVRHPQRAREATEYIRHLSIDERFFKGPIPVPKKTHSTWETVVFAFQSLGIVYGDLGTSPLYVYPSISCAETPDEEDYLGILSLIFWTLTLIGVVKYTLLVLYADDHGEGGTFAMYSLLCQHTTVGGQSRKLSQFTADGDSQLSHFHNAWGEDKKPSRMKKWLENHKHAQGLLLFVVMLGTCMLIGDGVLTPAISVGWQTRGVLLLSGSSIKIMDLLAQAVHAVNFVVTRLCEGMKFAIVWSLDAVLSAIGGIQVAVPTISQTVIIWVSAVILIVVFFFQKYGTNKVAFLFSPIMALWLLTTPMVGIYNIIQHYPSIFKAFSPYFIYRFFQKNGKQGWQMLGGIVLCITGSEAMFADLGHFNRLSIQMAFSLGVYPAVLLTYAGQTAYLINNPDQYLEGFFKMIPMPVFWPMFIIATTAAVVASQGLITATFSVVKQSVALDYFPPVKIVHTSEDTEGQIYSPEVNYGLMVLCLAVIFGFQNATQIGNAFGVAVVCVMVITTCLMTIIMLVIWDTSWVLVLLFFTVFIVIEGCYLSVVMTKIPQGGWVPFIISIVFTLIMTSWNHGRQKKFDYEMKAKITKKALGELISGLGDLRVPGVCFFYTDLFHGVPPIVNHYVRNVRTLHKVLIFTTIRHIPIKTVLPEERFLVGRIGFKGVYRCVARYGYMDLLSAETTYFLDQVTQCLTEHIGSALDFSDNPDDMEKDGEMEIQMIREAKEAGAVYVLGRSEFKVDDNTSYADWVFAGLLYPFLNSICRSPVSSLHIPPASFLEVGMFYDLL